MTVPYFLSHIYHNYWKDKKQFTRKTDRPRSWIMMIVEEGCFRFCIDHIEGTASSGDIVICPSHFPFDRSIIKPLSFHYMIFKFQNEEDYLQNRFIDILRQLYQFKFTTSEKDRLFNNCRHLYRLSLRNDSKAIKWKNHLLNDIWFLLMIDTEQRKNRIDHDHDPLMKKAKNLIEKGANGEVVMKQIAKKLQLHPVQFTRRFQAVYQQTPYQYLTAVRMEKAKSLLIHTDYTIDHIARNCGYSNGFYFSRIFSKYEKMNPSQYRRIHAVPSP